MTEAPRDRSASEGPAPFWKVWRWKFHWQVLLAVVVGAVIGLVWARLIVFWERSENGGGTLASIAGFKLQVIKLIGDLFLAALKSVVVPLVVSSLALSVSGLGARQGFGKMAGITLGYFLTSSLIAVVIGLVCVNLIRPGDSPTETPLLDAASVSRLEEGLGNETKTVQSRSAGTSTGDLFAVFRNLIPANPFQAAAETNLLGLITIAVAIGLMVPRLAPHLSKLATDLLQVVHDITMGITNAILRTAPIGVGCLMIATLAEQGAKLLRADQAENLLSLLGSLGWFAAATIIGLTLHVTVVLPTFLFLFGRISPLKHYRAMMPAMLTAFSTSSSNATLPVSIDCVENGVGVSNRTASFVLPLGATVNMDGTALYECVAAMFVVQLFGIDLPMADQLLVVIVALLTSVGVAGVPSASLVAIIIILQALETQLRGRGIEAPLLGGLALILVFDRVLDMARTVVNILSDSVGTVIVARAMGETDLFSRRD